MAAEGRPNGRPESSADEESHLLGTGRKTSHHFTRVRSHLMVDVRRHWGDLILLFCYVITGLLDSSSISIWSAFVSMQTGNTVYFGLGIVDPTGGTRWIKSGTSIAFFCLGSLFFSSFHRYFSPKRRWVFLASYTMQLMLIMIAAIMVTSGEAGGAGATWHVLIPLAMLAFQSSGQAVTSRVLQFNGLPSVVLTSTYCDLFSDPKLFTSGITQNVERNRRVTAIVFLLGGALMGGFFAHSDVGMAGALWTAVVLKFFVILAWLFWPAEPDVQS